jgi:hypothetical protein
LRVIRRKPAGSGSDQGSVTVPLLAVLFLVLIAVLVMFRMGQAAYLQWRAQTGADAAALAAAKQTRQDLLDIAKAIEREDYTTAAAIRLRMQPMAYLAATRFAARNHTALTSFSWETVEVEVQVASYDTVPHPCGNCRHPDPDCVPSPAPSTPEPSGYPSVSASPVNCEETEPPDATRGRAIARAKVSPKLTAVTQSTTAEEFADIMLIRDRSMAAPAAPPARPAYAPEAGRP